MTTVKFSYMSKQFKYTPEVFGELTVTVLHFDLLFDVFDDSTTVTSHLRFRAKKEIGDLVLDAKDLEVKSVSSDDVGVVYNYDKKHNCEKKKGLFVFQISVLH